MKNSNRVSNRVSNMAAVETLGTLTEETFSIKVKGEDEERVYDSNPAKTPGFTYENAKEPFSWHKLDNFADVLRSEGSDISEDAIAFLAEALDSEKSKKAVAAIVETVNGVNRANAKNNAYQACANKYTVMSEDDKAKAFERMVSTFAKIQNVSEDIARKTLQALKVA